MISQPYTTPTGLAINKDSYTEIYQAIKLVTTFEIYQKTLDIHFHQIFWEHLLEKSRQFLNDKNIKFVPKSENPPNTPEIRCTEDFWSLLKREV